MPRRPARKLRNATARELNSESCRTVASSRSRVQMPRIVTLLPSATEIVCALGFENQLVGRSHECDFPESVRSLPVCTSPKFTVEGSSYQIDQRVKAILQESLGVYRVDGDKLRELEPD